MVHMGAVDVPVSVGDMRQIAAEFRRAMGTGKAERSLIRDAPTTNGVDVLGWDFAFELNAVAEARDDYAKTFLVIAPTVIVFERLKGDFAGSAI